MDILKQQGGGNYIYFNQIQQLMTPTIKINDVTLGTKHSTLDNYFISGNVWSEGRGEEGLGDLSGGLYWSVVSQLS